MSNYITYGNPKKENARPKEYIGKEEQEKKAQEAIYLVRALDFYLGNGQVRYYGSIGGSPSEVTEFSQKSWGSQ